MPCHSINPATGDLLKTFPQITNAQLDAKMVAAAACFATWRHKTYAEQARMMTTTTAQKAKTKDGEPA